MEKTQNSPAIEIAQAHIQAWSNHDWDKTRQLLGPDVRVLVATISPQWRVTEYLGIENYMVPKMKAAKLIEPGSVRVLSATGDRNNALVAATMRIAMGPGGTMITFVRSCLYKIDDARKISEEMDQFFVLP